MQGCSKCRKIVKSVNFILTDTKIISLDLDFAEMANFDLTKVQTVFELSRSVAYKFAQPLDYQLTSETKPRDYEISWDQFHMCRIESTIPRRQFCLRILPGAY